MGESRAGRAGLMAAPRHVLAGIRNPRELVAGLVLVAVAIAAFWLGNDLAMGRMTRPGPGYVPRLLAVLIGLFGIAVCARAWTTERSGPVRWNLRAVTLILGSILLFALLLRGFGFGVASLALLMTASLASPDFKPFQAVLFALALTAFAVAVFSWGLGLTVQVFPW